MKKILGLDLGTNSIGWAVVQAEDKQLKGIECSGSRIIPMDAATIGDFNKGDTHSQAAERTKFRGVRRLRQRYLLRRERIHRILNCLTFLPKHYVEALDFKQKLGQFKSLEKEVKLPWREDEFGNTQFLFQDSFQEMLEEFRSEQPNLIDKQQKVPYDWTLYYLRKKALTQAITKEELAWIILNFNVKRGYNELRGEEEEQNDTKRVEYHSLKVLSVEDTGEKKGKATWYNVHLENNWIYKRTSEFPLDWEGKQIDFIVTTQLEKDGTPKTDKEGNVRRSLRMPDEKDWMLLKKKTEKDIDQSGKTLGVYIYEQLLANPKQKIRGSLVSTIDRQFYKDELYQILTEQAKYHTEITDEKYFELCLDELYKHNEAHRNARFKSDFISFLLNDVIFYQRPLRSKKSEIADCSYESRSYVDHETGEIKKVAIKCIPKSNPHFQAFRLIQFISNLKVYEKEKIIDGKLRTDVDVTSDFFKGCIDYQNLYEKLNQRKEIDQKAFLKQILKVSAKDITRYRWNYVEDKKYPCNETRAQFLTAFKKVNIKGDFLTSSIEMHLWHMFYSISDKKEWKSALKKFQQQHDLPDEFVGVFSKLPPYAKDYGAYSEKAIKKLLLLMQYSSTEKPLWLRQRIQELLENPEIDFMQRATKNGYSLKTIEDFKGLPVWLSCYIIYNRHSEIKTIDCWKSPEKIDNYLAGFKQHSLRNPVVEQVVMETLRTVRDIWKKVGHIDEIHLEIGRDMKNPADKRKRMTMRSLENERANYRIKQLLMELSHPEYEVENVRPHSPSQQQLLRIYETTVFNEVKDIPDEISDIVKKFSETNVKKQPTKREVMRYKLWLEQKYRSPYTGEIIPLGRLFTTDYQIEHVIPQSVFFDDSISNKVICEAAVNKLKSNQFGYEFIQQHPGEIVDCGFGKKVTLFTEEEYERFVKQTYANERSKKNKLLMDEVPAKFAERQMNDSRYISKFIQSLLSNIVREEGEEEVTAKRLISCSGGVTDRLKRDWGVNDVWNHLMTPRYERLNKISGTEDYGYWTQQDGHHFFRTQVPLELQKGFNKKRIDHRHHAMDAMVIACVTRNHINYLNNESARTDAKTSRRDLQHLLCDKHRTDEKGNYKWIIKKPWDSFTTDVKQSLSEIVISFKQNLRVLTRVSNKSVHFDTSGKKEYISQEKGDRRAIRKPMHKDTVFGRVNLRFIKTESFKQALLHPQYIVDKSLKQSIKQLLLAGKKEKEIKQYLETHKDNYTQLNLKKIDVYTYTEEVEKPCVATRKSLDDSFTKEKIEKSITDTGIQKILLAHLAQKEDNPKIAFTPEGIDEMNRNLVVLNAGKQHQPIRKVRVYEPLGSKYAVGETGNKRDKYVEAAKGTNLYYGVYADAEGKRNYSSIPLNIVIERKKQGDTPVPERDEKENDLLFYISPCDLVYVPTPEEIETGIVNESLNSDRIYKMVSCTGKRSSYIPYAIANSISSPLELGPNNKSERAWTGEMIKEICIPLLVDRLGNVKIHYKK